MKKVFVILLSILTLSACANVNGLGKTQKKNLSVYLDYSEAATEDYKVKVENARAYGSSNYNFSISLLIKNLTNQRQEINFTNVTLIRESTNTEYVVNPYSSKLELDSEIEGTISFSSIIPTSLDEKYYFLVDFKNINYKVFLYETPDELRKDLTVSYVVNDSIVHTETVKKGRTIQDNYIYDTNDHQSYAASWKDSNNRTCGKGTKVEKNMTLTSSLSLNLQLMTTSSDTYMFINGINHVHADGKIVINEKYQNKEVSLGNFAIYNNSSVKEVYLPSTLHHIYINNFSKCGNLRTIYFAGTEIQWDAIPKDFVTIPASVNIVFNTSFTY